MQLYTCTDACRNIFNTIRMSRHSSLEKYTSHFIQKAYERFYCVRGELETKQNCNILTPSTLLAITAFLSRSPGLLNRGPGGSASAGTWFSFQHLLSNWSNFLLHPGYIIIWRPPASCECHNSHSIQPIDSQGYPPISSTGCTCYLHRCISLFDSLAGGQYVTLLAFYRYAPSLTLSLPSFFPQVLDMLWVQYFKHLN